MLWEATLRDNWGDFLSYVLGAVTYLLLYQDNDFHTEDNKDFFLKEVRSHMNTYGDYGLLA